MTDDEKKIISDEDWKEQAQREKEKLSRELDRHEEPVHEQGGPLPEPTFSIFISGLATEAYKALGEVENPITKQKKRDLAHAKYVIDLMAMIQEKTSGNLSQDEGEGLEALLYDLRMRFVSYSNEVPSGE